MSPTRASATALIPPCMYPTSPLRSTSTGVCCPGAIVPTSSTSCAAPLAMKRTLSPFLISPSTTRICETTPTYAS